MKFINESSDLSVAQLIAEIKSRAALLEQQIDSGFINKTQVVNRMCDDIAYRYSVTDEVEKLLEGTLFTTVTTSNPPDIE